MRTSSLYSCFAGWVGPLLMGLLLMGQEPCNPEVDADGDGYTASQGDCDDANGTVYPGAPEYCDGLDNDCDPATGDQCSTPGLQLETKSAYVLVSGQDNGRVEPATYSETVTTAELDLFTPSISGQLEYVGSAATQFSTQDEDVIEVNSQVSAGGKDDYGYGKGTSSAESRQSVTFSVLQPLKVKLTGAIEASICSDGGTLRQFITISDATGALIYLADQPGNLSWATELPAGQYTFTSYAWSTVSISGGGDAYPCAHSSVSAFFERVY